MSTFVLVPGAWLGGWVWDRVTPILESKGHHTVAVTLPGLAERAAELSPQVGIMAHVNDVLGLCRRLGKSDLILVGHSYAGAVVGAVARRAPDRMRAQVYLDTLPLQEGKSLLDGFSPNGKVRFSSSLMTTDGTRVWPMPDPLGDQAPVDGLTDADMALLRTRGTPHPALTFEEKLTGSIGDEPYPRNHAISCVEDEEAAKVERGQFLAEHPDWTYHSLPICHWPMLSSPDKLASVLDDISLL